MATLSMLAKHWITEIFVWWQIPLVILLIAIIVFWIMYRRKQM